MKILQRNWHRFFGHPEGYVKARRHVPAVRVHHHIGHFANNHVVEMVELFCCECRGRFWKRVRR